MPLRPLVSSPLSRPILIWSGFQLNGIDARPSSELPNRELRDRIELLRKGGKKQYSGR
ncbi:MAG: hypothetical protein R3D29_07410 [Nitratireductor sp.]